MDFSYYLKQLLCSYYNLLIYFFSVAWFSLNQNPFVKPVSEIYCLVSHLCIKKKKKKVEKREKAQISANLDLGII